MQTRSRLLALVLAGGLLLAGCGDEDATEEGLVRTLTNLKPEDGRAITTEQAECIAGTLYGQFDAQQIEQIADASSPEELPPGALDAINAATDSCGLRQGG
jgi:hypothetical protein